jgi:hypothetical protein
MILILALILTVPTVLAYACILAGKAADTLDNTTDEHAEHLFIGGGAGAFHAVPITHEGQHEHV